MVDRYLEIIFNNQGLLIIFSFVSALIITYVSIPSIIAVARAKLLFDTPNGRTTHTGNIPTLGGLAIFAGVFISCMIFLKIKLMPDIQYIVAGSLIIFFIGLKDDILTIAAPKKLILQIVASLIVILLGDIRITSLHSFLGIYEINYFASVIITLFVMIVVINAFNLIDGIDGLASGVGILSSMTLGIWFYLAGEYQLAILATSMIGALISFFIYNVFGKKNKIFMGDIGSLLLGFLTVVLIIKFNEINKDYNIPYFIHSAPAVSIGILIIPLFDTLRVFVVRLAKGQSPFKADMSHVHHRLLMITKKHLKTTVILLWINVGFIVLVFTFNYLSIYKLTLILLILAILLSYLPVWLFQRQQKKQ